MPKQDPFESYEDLEAYLKELPMTWYPALITTMVEAAYDKKVFRPGLAHQFIKKSVDDQRWPPDKKIQDSQQGRA